MSPSITTTDQDQQLQSRPLKRPRKATTSSRPPQPDDTPFTSNGPVDHIFIADGIINKKPVKKVPLSCCECRRLKLKCDRNFPCASCKKRGCAEICPDGVLVSGKGTRFILANTEQLHAKIHEMSDRIRSLEDALQKLQSEKTTESHPLMHPDLLGIKSTMGLYSGSQNTNDMPGPTRVESNAHRNGRTQEEQMEVDRGDRGSSEDMDMAIDQPLAGERRHFKQEHTESLASEVLRLSHAFPLPDNVNPEPNIALRGYIRSQLPARDEADYLWEQARQNALWQYNPHPSSTFYPNLAHHCYTANTEELNPRRLALLFMVLAVGCLVDLKYRPPDCPDAEKFHQLARASLCEIPVMEETNVETITALFYEIWYLLVFSDKKKAAGYAWGLMGLTAKLAQSIGLHRNGGKSKVIPEEVEKRRSLFWELLYLDARLSLSLGRPPSLSINHMDCPQPSYTPDDDCSPSESLHHYQEWKHSCYLQCLAPVLDAISKPSLEYSAVLDLDKKIRDFAIPIPLRQKDLHSRSLIMQKASLSTVLEAVLLQLHRTFFTRALSGPEEAFNRRHKYAPSVVAVFLSASRMIATVQDLYHREPQLTARILGYWSNAFSAAVALCLLVSRAPFTCLSPAALQELERARILFKSAKDTCPRALQVIPILETMIDKANLIYNRWSNGQELPTIVLQHITDEFTVDSDVSPNMPSANSVPNGPENGQPLSPSQVDSFIFTHRSLSQCIVEAHQRAKSLFPMRKPCKCSITVAKNCPPSHSWAPPPSVPQQTSPVLPEVPPALTLTMPTMSPSAHPVSRGSPSGHGVSPVPSSSPGRVSSSPALSDGYGLYSAQVLPVDGPAIPPPPVPTLISPTSKMAVVDTINFELGALNSNSDQSWMAFF